MKLNRKIIIPAFTLLVGTALAGSAASTVAWYQYSTRANVSYIGTSAGTIGNLQLRIKGGEWGTNLRIQDVEDYLLSENIGQEVEPITPGSLAKNDSLKQSAWKEVEDVTVDDELPQGSTGHAYFIKSDDNSLYKYENDAWNLVDGVEAFDNDHIPSANNYASGAMYVNSSQGKLFEKELKDKDFYVNPQMGMSSYDTWIKASKANYVVLPLQLRFIEGNEDHLSAEDVYLSKLLIQEDRQNGQHGDISNAVRVHFSAYADGDEDHAVNHLVSKNGGTTLTHGKLKLGGGADFDKAYADDDEFGFNGSDYTYVQYGGNSGSQNCYSAAADASSGYYYEEEAPVSGWNELPGMLNGDVEPDDADGDNGNFYFDSVAEKLYQKNNDAWEEIVGVIKGADEPNLDTQGQNTYNYYVKLGENKLYERVFPAEEAISPALVGIANDSLALDKITDEKKIGSTIITRDNQNEEQKYLNVVVTIWVEGWQKFERDGRLTSIWDRSLIDAMFDVGIQFAVQDR